MQLSVIIVNYNVEHFLEQCLLSVRSACQGLEAEVFVVDNQSVDGSCAMVRERFPDVNLIENQDNVGFSKANNQAIHLAQGRYILLLNPDTVVEEDTFTKVVEFMDAHPNAGGLGVRMVDGKGRFLPESKRGLPTPWVAFCKISGIYRVFKSTKRFNHYYMGYLSEHEVNEVEILSGAFMLMRKTALDEVGLLDEAFFMYGEDIDLSWRIVQGGYKNYYFPSTSIIHYKGESTKKGSLNYVFVFYQAMVIFARKHFSEKNARLFTGLINLAIYARAALAVLNRFVQSIWLPLLDAAVLFWGLWLMQDAYAAWQEKIFEPKLLILMFSAYAAGWMSAVFFSGGYDKPLAAFRIFRGVLIGSVLVLVGYSLLPEDLRFSRAMVLLGSLWALVYFLLSRALLATVAPALFTWSSRKEGRFIVLGGKDEGQRISELLKQTTTRTPEVFLVEVPADLSNVDARVRLAMALRERIRVFKADVVIFSGRDLPAAGIIDLMSQLADLRTEFKIAPPDSLYMIGSNSIDTTGDLFMLETNGVQKAANRRNKRMFDLFTAGILLLSFPVTCWFMASLKGYFGAILAVLFGQKSWVGFAPQASKSARLPKIRPGVLHPAMGLSSSGLNDETGERLNIIYARDYRISNDLRLVLRHFNKLG
jgi:GT2 family glycosyltransferase